MAKHLVVLGNELVEALLDDVIAVEVLDKHYDMEAQGEYNRVYLSIVFEVSLHCPVSDIGGIQWD